MNPDTARFRLIVYVLIILGLCIGGMGNSCKSKSKKDTGKIIGKVMDRASGKPIFYAQVITSDEFNALTEWDGTYSLEHNTGVVTLNVEAIGYEPTERSQVKIERGREITMDFALSPLDSDGDEVLDESDNCPNYENTNQEDQDGDGAGDVCDAYPKNPSLRSNPDADNDGMPDAWEAENGLDVTRDDGKEDPDDDAIRNLQEFVLRAYPKT